MKKIIASLIAVAFLAVSGLTFAADKAGTTEMKKDEKSAPAADKNGKKAKSTKKKKEGC